MLWRNFIFRKQLFNFNYNLCTCSVKVPKSLRSSVANFSNVPKTSLLESIPKDQQLTLKTLANVYSKIDFENITTQEGQLLLQCCGISSVNSTYEERHQMCNNVYENLVKHNKLNLDIYHTYIQICTENRTIINTQIFLECLKFQPDNKIFRFLLENVCECGDLSQAFIVLENMKHYNVPLDENIFKCLALVHTLKGGLEAGEEVLATMKTAQVLETEETHVAILKGIIKSQNYEDFKNFLDKYKLILNEDQIINILKELGISQNVDWLTEMKPFFSELVITREFVNNLKNICIYLVYLNKVDSAIKLYTYFQQQPEENYGFFILEEMVHSKMDSNEIISTAKFFFNNYNNEQVFENLTDFTIKHKYFEMTWELFGCLKELRSHFFWPLLLDAKDESGETGIFNIIEKINKLDVKLDSDTLEFYILPFCSLDDVTSAVEKLKRVGFTVREIINPMLLVLLRDGQVKKATLLCKRYNVQIQGHKLFKFICSAWKNTKDSSIIFILQKYCEYRNDDHDLMGDFLIIALKGCRFQNNFEEFSKLLKVFGKNNLKITTSSADVLREIVAKEMGERETKLSEQILDGIDQILEFKLKTEVTYIPHPRDMNLEELECHLAELTKKGMETRGVLRRLIQMHANIGSVKRVDKLRQMFLDAGYVETLGMKSSLMHSYAKAANWKSALNTYKEIKKINPNFFIDEYKVLDLATVLANNDKLTEAKSLIEEASNFRVKGGMGVQRNCVDLLNAITDENEQSSMLDFLVANNFCKYNNIMLGPLIRIHLNSGDLEKASTTFVKIAEKFKCTPLQFELIKEIAKLKNEDLLQKILDCTSNIHGPLSTQVTLICVLAELGDDKILKKILATTQFQIRNEINKRCERWIKEGKSEALITLANSCNRLPNDLIDIKFVYESIMKTYVIKNNCEGAVRFYQGLLENDVPVNKNLENQLYILLKQNNYLIPNSLRINNEQ